MNDDNVKELVLARLATLPLDASISIGSFGKLSRDVMIAHVKKGDPAGQKIAKIEMEFLAQFKNKKFYEEFASH